MGRREENKHTAIFTAFDELLPHDPAETERNLLRAILMSALSDLDRPGEARRRAEQYFLSREEDYIFSFRSICTYLNIDADRILTVSGITPPEEKEVEREPGRLHPRR